MKRKANMLPKKTYHKNQIIPPRLPCSKLRRGSCGCVGCSTKTLNYKTKDEEELRTPVESAPTQQVAQEPTQK